MVESSRYCPLRNSIWTPKLSLVAKLEFGKFPPSWIEQTLFSPEMSKIRASLQFPRKLVEQNLIFSPPSKGRLVEQTLIPPAEG